MRSVIRNHVLISILLAEAAVYAVAYLISGWPGVHLCALGLLILWILGGVIAAEKLAASLRKESSA